MLWVAQGLLKIVSLTVFSLVSSYNLKAPKKKKKNIQSDKKHNMPALKTNKQKKKDQKCILQIYALIICQTCNVEPLTFNTT